MAPPSLSWTCPNCRQQVPAGQANCPNCATGAGTPSPPASRQSRSRPTFAGRNMTLRNKKIVICVAGGISVVFLISLLMWGYPSRKPSTPPSKPQPQAQQQQQPATPSPAKPSPMAPAPAATSATPSPPAAPPAKPSSMPPKPAARPARIPATSSPELVRELRQINSRLGEINRRIPAEQAGKAVKALAEITYLLEQGQGQTASASADPPAAQPRRERLSDRELERRYKERLLSQEPQRQQEDQK